MGCAGSTVAAAPDGSVWVGLDDTGLGRFDGKAWTTHRKSDGLAGREVRAIIVDSRGNTWAATDNRALSRFDGQKWTIGLCNDTVLCMLEGPDGRLWFGTDSAGIAVLDNAR